MDAISYKEEEGALLLSCVVEGIQSLPPPLTPGQNERLRQFSTLLLFVRIP